MSGWFQLSEERNKKSCILLKAAPGRLQKVVNEF